MRIFFRPVNPDPSIRISCPRRANSTGRSLFTVSLTFSRYIWEMDIGDDCEFSSSSQAVKPTARRAIHSIHKYFVVFISSVFFILRKDRYLKPRAHRTRIPRSQHFHWNRALGADSSSDRYRASAVSDWLLLL